MSNQAGRRRGNTRPQGNNTALRRAMRQEHHRIDGVKLHPGITPPQYVRLPWNSFTFSASYETSAGQTNSIQVTVGNIRSQIVSRMGLSGAPGKIAMKIIRGYAWNVATGNGLAEPYMRGLFYEITPSASVYAFRSDQADHGTFNRPARVGYQYPLRDQKEIVTATDDSYVLAQFYSNPNVANGAITIRFQVLWLCTNDAESFLDADVDAQPGAIGLEPSFD